MGKILKKQFYHKKGVVLLFDCNRITEYEYNTVFQYVTESRRIKTEQYNNYQDRVLSLMAEFSLIYAMKKIYNLSKESYTISKHEKGKPYFVEADMPKFNISHTHNLVAVLISDSEVGIDVENIKYGNEDSINKIIRFMFTQEECSYIDAGIDKVTRFYNTWTAREAYCKMTGQGLLMSERNKSLPKGIEKYGFQFGDYYINICGILKDDIEIIVMGEKDIKKMCSCLTA